MLLCSYMVLKLAKVQNAQKSAVVQFTANKVNTTRFQNDNLNLFYFVVLSCVTKHYLIKFTNFIPFVQT